MAAMGLRLIEECMERVVNMLIVAELDDVSIWITKHADVTDGLGKIDSFPFETTSGECPGGDRINVGTLGHFNTEVRKRKQFRLRPAVMFIEVHQYEYERMLR
jgi:hypothetical protein